MMMPVLSNKKSQLQLNDADQRKTKSHHPGVQQPLTTEGFTKIKEPSTKLFPFP